MNNVLTFFGIHQEVAVVPTGNAHEQTSKAPAPLSADSVAQHSKADDDSLGYRGPAA